MFYKVSFFSFILFLVLFLVPCATAIKEIPLSLKPSLHKGFSVILPIEKGWMGADDNSEVMGKLGTHNDETYAIEMYVSDIPESKSHNEINSLFDKPPKKESDSEGFKIISQETKKVVYKGQPAWRVKIVTEDRANINGKLMILEIYRFFVLHPQDKEIILLSYSHRYYPGDEDVDIDNKVNQFFNSLEFLNF